MKLSKMSESMAGLMEGLTPRQLLLLSGGAGLLTFLLIYFVLSGSSAPEEVAKPVETPMAKVVEAKTDIPARAEIRESMIQLVDVPKQLVPAGALTETPLVVGRPARVAILAGDVITDKKLYKNIKESGFTGTIPEDCRAVSIGIDDVTGVAGFAKPGDYVDVMLVSDKIETEKITGEIIMQNVMLLGINKMTNKGQDVKQPDNKNEKDDKKNGQDQGEGAVDKPATATLAVHPEDVLRLAVASQAGKVYLVLRPYKPASRFVLDTEYYLPTGRQTNPPAPAPAQTPAPVVPPSYTPPRVPETKDASDGAVNSKIEVIRGTNSSKGK